MRRRIVDALAALGALWLLVTVTPVLFWWIASLARPWDGATGEILVVLGNDVHAGGEMGYASYLRALHALRTYRAGAFREVVVAGGQGVAEGIREYLAGNGVPPDRILVEGNSRSTRENAIFTAQLIRGHPGRVVLVTSDIHTYRAWRVFRKAGLAVRTSPAPDAGKRAHQPLRRWGVFLDLCLETAKVGWYWARGWL